VIFGVKLAGTSEFENNSYVLPFHLVGVEFSLLSSLFSFSTIKLTTYLHRPALYTTTSIDWSDTQSSPHTQLLNEIGKQGFRKKGRWH
jgi:hypothetical protein